MHKKNLQRAALMAVCCLPALAMADGSGGGAWAVLQQWGTTIRLGLYGVGGTIGLGCLMWSGIQWQIARSTADRSTTFMDYLQNVGVLVVVGGTMVLGAAAWQVFGTGAPA